MEENKTEQSLDTETTSEGSSDTTANQSTTKGNGAQEARPNPTEELQQQVEKWKNDYLYLRAEFETYKRNAIKERSEISKYGSERLISDLLTVADNFDRALSTKATAENIEVYSQGVKMSAAELKSVLGRFGVTEIKCEGLPFDPNMHEALGAEESEDVAEGHILRVFRNAYKLHDRVIRPAQVIVAKAPAK